MSNLLDYIAWRGDLSFRHAPLNQVDGAVFSRLSYLPFEEVLEEGATMALGQAALRLLETPDIDKKVLTKLDISLMEAVTEGERFAPVEVMCYVSRRDLESQSQFSAVTFRIGLWECFVAFRGTDHTLVGWKEDFNMSFTFPVPAQLSARSYFEEVCRKLPQNSFYLGGHSKGGNLAVYTGAFCGEALQERILGIFNYDGPGFPEEVLGMPGYQRIYFRVESFIPQSSVVGLLLEREEQSHVVHSTQVGLLQHDIYSWDVARDHFVYLETTTAGSRHLDRTLKDWLTAMSPEERELLVETLYRTVAETNAATLKELGEHWFSNARIVARNLKNLDEDSRKRISEALRLLMRSVKNEVLPV